MIKIVKEVGRDSVEMKVAYADFMLELGEKNPLVVDLEADLAVCLNMRKFNERFPGRYYNIGIAEQSLSSIAAGMSGTGLIPFAHSFACFASRRMCDQNYISCGFADCNVKIVGSDPGIAAGINGGTHQANEDIAIMRSIPRITIVEPCDTVMLKWVLNKAAATEGMFYIRVQRSENIRVYEEGSEFELGKANMLKDGKDVSIITSGSLMIEESLKAADILANEGINARVIDMFTIKPIDTDCIIKCAKETEAIVTVENHNIIGGLGSAVAETLAEQNQVVPFTRIGIPDRIGEVGSPDELKNVMKMRAVDIASAVKRLLNHNEEEGLHL